MNITTGQKITRHFDGETYTGTIVKVSTLDTVHVVWDDEPNMRPVAMRLDEIEIVTADNTAAEVETFIESINGNPANYDLDAIATDLNRAGIDLAQLDPQREDGVYYQEHEQQVWTILAAHDHS